MNKSAASASRNLALLIIAAGLAASALALWVQSERQDAPAETSRENGRLRCIDNSCTRVPGEEGEDECRPEGTACEGDVPPGFFLRAWCGGGNDPAVELSWGGSEGAASYDVWRRPPGGVWGKIGREIGGLGFVDDVVPGGGRFEYAIEAIGPTGRVESNIRSVDTTASACGAALHHFECRQNSCTRVSGAGDSQCQGEGSYCGATHLECVNASCTKVPGAGPNRCAPEGSACQAGGPTHRACRRNACVTVSGPGPDTCGGDADCILGGDIDCNGGDRCAVPYGSTALISWKSGNAGSCTAAPGWSGVSGSRRTEALTESQTFMLVCNGAIEDSVTVTVIPPPPPGCTLEADPTRLVRPPAGSAILRWKCAGTVAACTLLPGVGAVAGTGERVVAPTSTVSYELSCSGPGGEDADGVLIQVFDASSGEIRQI